MGNTIEAREGIIGIVDDTYFDDDTWTIRYLIVKTGDWFSGRKVLISTTAFGKETVGQGTFSSNLSIAQITMSPDIDIDKPVSRHQEAELAAHYSWQSYWGNDFYPDRVWGVIASPPITDPAPIREQKAMKSPMEDLRLQSSNKITGYRVRAGDGDVGYVHAFIMDERTWQLSHLVVLIHNWLGGKKVTVPVRYIQSAQWDESSIFVDMTIDVIRKRPVFDEPEYHTGERSGL